jgi:hypothetical protein
MRWFSFTSAARFGHVVLAAALVLVCVGSAPAQLTWNHTFLDAAGTGFNDTTAAGSTTVGALRRASAMAATDYLSTILDGRGTIRLQWNTSLNSPGSGLLAQFGAGSVPLIDGTFQGGPVYQRARSNTSPNFGEAFDGQGQVNFGKNWHYAVPGTNTTLNSSTLDLVSVLSHEITHSLGFSDFSSPTGQGFSGNPLGSPDTYSSYDRHLQKGNVAGVGSMLRSDITQSNYGSFNTSVGTGAYTGGNTQNGAGTSFTNNTTNGLYFSGTYANEVFAGPVPLYSPTSYVAGSSVSHVNVGPGATYGSGPIGLMNFQIGTNTTRRLQPYEIGMLMDLGWNVYNWNNTGGNWLDGVSNLAQSRWRTDSGIVLDANGSTQYNTFASPQQAPILPPYAQVTSNIVLNFGGSGASGYTTTNDIGSVRLARLNLSSTAATAITISGGTLNFGQNSDGSASVIIPKIVQQNSGAVVIASTVQTNNVATQVVNGVTFPGSPGLTADGSGSGRVSITGQVTGTGSLTKGGNFTLDLSNNLNNYSGGTTVSAGALFVNNSAGSATGTGAVSVQNGATLGGAGRINGALTVQNGGTLAPGNGASSTGILTLGAASHTLGVSGTGEATFQVHLNGITQGTNYDQLAIVNGGSITLADVGLLPTLGYTPGASDKLFIIDNQNATGGLSGTFNNLFDGTMFTIGTTNAWIYYTGDFGSLSLTGGNDVVISFAPVPEPTSVLGICFLAGLAAMGWRRGRRQFSRRLSACK